MLDRIHTCLRIWRPLLLGLAAVGGMAHAQVLEIADDGAVIRHDGPALYLTPDPRPQPIRPAALPGAPAVETLLANASAAHGVSLDLARAVAWHESRFRPDVVSAKGAVGVMQLMPATARFLGVDPYDPAANIEGGVSFLGQLLRRYDGDLVRTLAAYDAGPGAVARFGGVPPFRETQAYVAAILGSLGLTR